MCCAPTQVASNMFVFSLTHSQVNDSLYYTYHSYSILQKPLLIHFKLSYYSSNLSECSLLNGPCPVFFVTLATISPSILCIRAIVFFLSLSYSYCFMLLPIDTPCLTILNFQPGIIYSLADVNIWLNPFETQLFVKLIRVPSISTALSIALTSTSRCQNFCSGTLPNKFPLFYISSILSLSDENWFITYYLTNLEITSRRLCRS